MTSGDVTIGRLTLHLPDSRDTARDRGAAASAARWQIERLLSAIDWRPSGYRPGQVWVIRRLANLPPLDGRRAQGWAAAVERALDELFRHAVRVTPGAPSGYLGHAESLLFEDRADWLALLTLDVVGAQVWKRWYWQPTLAELPARYPGALLAAAWDRFPEHLPAALGTLATAQIERAIALFAPAEVNRVVRTLHEQHAIPANVFAVSIPDEPVAVEVDRPAAPWERWTPPLPTALAPQARYLYGLILTLSRAPGYARSATFARAAATWLEYTLAREHLLPHTSAAAGHTRKLASGPGRTNRPMDSTARPVDASVPEASPAAPARDDGSAVPIARGAQHTEAERSGDPVVDVRPTAGQPGAAEFTTLGGVLFLIHALAWLGLPNLHGEHIGGWAWLDIFARALLGVAPDDPIWDALRTLDRREPDAHIGAGWAPDEFRLPRQTVQRYLAGQWRAAIQDGRLLLARGDILVLDTPISAEHGDDLIAAAIRWYTEDETPRWEQGDPPAPFVVPPGLGLIAGQGVIGWVARAMPCLIMLLRRSFGDPALPIREIARRLIEQSGDLEITRTHVDLFLALESADIALRRAGLDRSPGWLPDYGHIIQFHYMQGEVRR
jgi:hypothetical protein